MKKRYLRLMSLTLSLLMILPIVLSSATAKVATDTSGGWEITNPYEDVDWDTWSLYKVQNHAHTTASDGNMDMQAVVEEYYSRGYDALSLTDHGMINKGWEYKSQMVPVVEVQAIFKTVNHLTTQRKQEIESGVGRDGRGMLDFMGIELNGVVIAKNHVNGYFANYGQGIWGKENDFETVIKGMDAAGGITHFNHLGDWTGGKSDVEKNNSWNNIKFFSDIFKKYDSCVGMEIVNRVDNITRNDRVLWDNLLHEVIPAGRNIWGFSNDDSHVLTDIGLTANLYAMPENTTENIRTAMETGAFFACSKRAKYELGDEFEGTGDFPVVTSISVDDVNDVISIECPDADKIEWVSGGKVIASGGTIRLADYADEITCYVRAQLSSEGGMCFTQPFVTDDGNMERFQTDSNCFTDFFLDVWYKLRNNLVYQIVKLIVGLF